MFCRYIWPVFPIVDQILLLHGTYYACLIIFHILSDGDADTDDDVTERNKTDKQKWSFIFAWAKRSDPFYRI